MSNIYVGYGVWGKGDSPKRMGERIYADTPASETWAITGQRWNSVMYAGVLSFRAIRDPRLIVSPVFRTVPFEILRPFTNVPKADSRSRM